VQIQPTLESRRKEITLYAIIRDRGMQYRVQEGQILDIALTSDVAAGGELTVSEVLLVGGEQTVVGNPTVSGASVVLKVIGDVQGDKIVVFRYKSKKRYRRRTGHRQDLTRVQVVKIDVSGADDAKPKATRRKSAAA
jgi:large subunit ribosomal protein L21